MKNTISANNTEAYIPFFILVASMFFLLIWQESTREVPLKPGEFRYKESPRLMHLAPNFSLPDLNGQKIELKDYRGKVVFLNFWATWCLTCEEEMPSMEKLYQKYKGNSFEMLTISIDKEGKQAVAPYTKKFSLTFSALLDPKSKVANLYRTTGVPETFIINKEGFIIHKAIGPRKWDTEESFKAFDNLTRL